MVVRESMSLDLLDKLITDIISVMEQLMSMTDSYDIGSWQHSNTSVEKTHGSQGLPHHQKHKAKRPMHHGVHRSVC